MIDTGHNASTGWRPSTHFRGQTIENLVITNFDEDHASDFHNLDRLCNVETLSYNFTVTSACLRGLKHEHGVGTGIEALCQWMSNTETAPGAGFVDIDWGGVTKRHFYNPYPTFDDENNLSVITFIEYGNFSIIFPGDLEITGWKELLKNREFQTCLSRVNVFVASHHGRADGYCKEVFDLYCSPNLVIISDDYLQYDTQATVNNYASKCTGVQFEAGLRKVLTTRNDGCIEFTKPGPNETCSVIYHGSTVPA